MNINKPGTATRVKVIAALGVAAGITTVALLGTPSTIAVAQWNTPVDSYIVAASDKKDPPNCTVNLIDYWAKNNSASTQTYPDEYDDESTSNGTYGINAGHYLTLGAQTGAWNAWTNNAIGTSKSGSSQGAFYNLGLDGNTGTGSGKAYRGIVNYNLGDDGYPRLALGDYAWLDANENATLSGRNTKDQNESLAYLFNPDNITDAYSQTARRGYADVKGLFRYGGESGDADMTGYYWYDSTVNFAEMRAKEGSGENAAEFNYFTTDPATKKDVSYFFNLYKAPLAGNDYAGQFFPLNYANRDGNNGDNTLLNFGNNGTLTARRTAWDDVTSWFGTVTTPGARSSVNHYFGMSMEVEFMQPAGYQVGGKDMTFTFAGDDDVWIFCDDVLIADLGGNHNALACDVNFSTGEIVYYASQQNQVAENAVWRVDYLSNCFGIDLDYGREAKGWVTTGTVPANDAAMQDYYMKTYNEGKGWISGRSGDKLNFYGAQRNGLRYTNLTSGSNTSGATASNARHAGNEDNTSYGTFEELTRHTLKFYFLEGGNMSNCMLKFNLSAIAD